MPTSGTGSKLNLATVEYVDTRESAITDQVMQNVTSRLPGILDEATKDERQRISALETALVAQQGQVAALVTSLDAVEQDVSQLSDMRQRVAGLESSNAELQALAGSLAVEMDTLPSDTLRELNVALGAHLATKQATPAGSATSGGTAEAAPQGAAQSEFRDAPDVAAPPPPTE